MNKNLLIIGLLALAPACNTLTDIESDIERITIFSSVDPYTSVDTRTVASESSNGNQIIMKWGWYEEVGAFAPTYNNACFVFHNNSDRPVLTAEFVSEEADAVPTHVYYPYISEATVMTDIPFSLFPDNYYEYFDESSVSGYDIKVAKKIDDYGDGTCSMTFQHMMAMLRFTVDIDDLGVSEYDCINSVVIECGAMPFSGEYTLNLKNKTFTRKPLADGEGAPNELFIDLLQTPSVSEPYTFYVPVAPMMLSKSEYKNNRDIFRWAFTINTDEYWIWFYIDIPADLDIEAGKCYDVPLSSDMIRTKGYYYDEYGDIRPGAFFGEQDPEIGGDTGEDEM